MPNMKRFVLLSRIPGYGGTRYAVLGDDLDACADCEFAARPLLGGSSITLVAFDHSDLPSAAFQLTGTDRLLLVYTGWSTYRQYSVETRLCSWGQRAAIEPVGSAPLTWQTVSNAFYVLSYS